MRLCLFFYLQRLSYSPYDSYLTLQRQNCIGDNICRVNGTQWIPGLLRYVLIFIKVLLETMVLIMSTGILKTSVYLLHSYSQKSWLLSGP